MIGAVFRAMKGVSDLNFEFLGSWHFSPLPFKPWLTSRNMTEYRGIALHFATDFIGIVF